MKTYYIQYNIDRCKYVVCYHDGNKKHKDGSNFFDIAIFKNKIHLSSFINNLKNQGYKESR